VEANIQLDIFRSAPKALVHEPAPLSVFPIGHGWQGPRRRYPDAARRYPHARFHAGWHRRDGQGDAARRSVRDTGADIILGNTYHLMLRPGAERMARLGGLHGSWTGRGRS
jgi:hypothetical protein